MIRALALAFANLLHPRMLWLMVWPVLIALMIWGAVALVFWTQAVLWLAAALRGWIVNATFFMTWDASDVALWAARILVLLSLVPLVQLTSILILGVFGMPAIVEHVTQRRYPSLEQKKGGSFAGSLWNSVVALAGLLGLGALSVPLWVFPPLWPLIPVAIMGWVDQRLLRYDALARHADPREMRALFASRRGALYALGAILALVAYLPVVGFFAPVLFGLAFVHYLLAGLKSLREQPIEGRVL